MKIALCLFAAIAAVVALSPLSQAAEPIDKPNVVIFYIDDMGWAQPGSYGGQLAPTPHMDAVAAAGVRFTDGYVSACICSPSRVGLMTGRYQQRSGHDANTTNRRGSELVLSEVTMAQRFKEIGYTTAIVGKWHLGATSSEYLPGSRGFDHATGSIGNLGDRRGEHEFFRDADGVESPPEAPITSPLFARQSIEFIDAHRDRPFLLYVSFNAVHTPHVAHEATLNRFAHIEDRRLRNYAANLTELDEAIGEVMARLRELDLERRTLVFLLSDNGGASPYAEMGGLRGRKWFVWEGGIRVSFAVQWKGRIPAGRVVNEPVIQLDILPTALAAVGAQVQPEWQLDGVNLLPLLEGKTQTLDREALYWRFGVQFAVRQGDWKLVKAALAMDPMLVNLASDPGETHDLSAQHPDKVRHLTALWESWNAQMQPPRWDDQRWNGEESRKRNAPKAKTRAATKAGQ